jgi:hypothetical protein
MAKISTEFCACVIWILRNFLLLSRLVKFVQTGDCTPSACLYSSLLAHNQQQDLQGAVHKRGLDDNSFVNVYQRK